MTHRDFLVPQLHHSLLVIVTCHFVPTSGKRVLAVQVPQQPSQQLNQR